VKDAIAANLIEFWLLSLHQSPPCNRHDTCVQSFWHIGVGESGRVRVDGWVQRWIVNSAL